MDFYYRSRLARGGDAQPRPGCFPLWHTCLRPLMPGIQLSLLVGGYAQLSALGKGTITARVHDFAACLRDRFPLPHSSWRTNARERKKPWFTEQTLSILRAAVARVRG